MRDAESTVHVFRTGGVTTMLIIYPVFGFVALLGALSVGVLPAGLLGLLPDRTTGELVVQAAFGLPVAILFARVVYVYRQRGYEVRGSKMYRNHGVLRRLTNPLADLRDIEAATAAVTGASTARTVTLHLEPRSGTLAIAGGVELSGLSHGTQRRLHALLIDQGVLIRNDWWLGFGKYITPPEPHQI